MGATRIHISNAFGCDLFLSTHAEDVRSALNAGFAAATILSGGALRAESNELRIAFDSDAVLFFDEAERVFKGRRPGGVSVP